LLQAAVGEARPGGLFLEFGVEKGASANFIAGLIAAGGASAVLHAFDSFEGLPESWEGTFETRGKFTVSGKIPRLPPNVRVHKGWFDATLPGFRDAHAGAVFFGGGTPSILNLRQWEEILRTNLTGTYHCCKVFLPAMIESQWGRIINIGSTTSKVAYAQVSAYTTSKHGLLGLTRSLALETARHGITVNAICPGYLDNELTRDNARRMAQKTGKSEAQILATFARSTPQNRLIEPQEVASLALFMASAKLGGMTGQAINVDGGAVMV
jgi:NAD(P)-dependent dehydrogenase (short-subunit alcohol dehydrogenase family)